MFEALQPPAPDKIMALQEAFRADPRDGKLDLGVGVYKDEAGRTPILESVKEAERRLLAAQETKTYLGPAGDAAFCDAMIDLVLGADAPKPRLAAVQTPGGTGAVRLCAEIVARAERTATVWIPEPSWPNHQAILRQAGLAFRTYPYFDAATCGVAWEALRDSLADAGPGDVVLLHGCCHNPTGADLTPAQWDELAALALDRGFTPFVDIAYQGFGDGLEADAYGVRALAAAAPEMLIAASCSKSFAVYRERVGCAIALSAARDAALVTQETMKLLARVNWSMPPDHGAAVVRMVLTDPALRAQWEAELTAMRERVLGVRKALAEALRTRTNSDRYDFLASHRGMFSLTGLGAETIARMRDDHGVYVVSDSRINVAGMNADGVARFADALAAAEG